MDAEFVGYWTICQKWTVLKKLASHTLCAEVAYGRFECVRVAARAYLKYSIL